MLVTIGSITSFSNRKNIERKQLLDYDLKFALGDFPEANYKNTSKD
jgi:hypothetical protein